jgi:hypothetical protein
VRYIEGFPTGRVTKARQVEHLFKTDWGKEMISIVILLPLSYTENKTLDYFHFMANTLLNRVFRDSEGTIVLAQLPNPPLIGWILASLLQIVFTTGQIKLGLDAVSFGCLFTWAWEELFQGVNYFRRGLGLIILVMSIAAKI